MFWAPWHQRMSTFSQPYFSTSTWKRGPVQKMQTSRDVSRTAEDRGQVAIIITIITILLCRISKIKTRKTSKLKEKSSASAEIARDAWNGHQRSLKVTRCCANRRGIYDFPY